MPLEASKSQESDRKVWGTRAKADEREGPYFFSSLAIFLKYKLQLNWTLFMASRNKPQSKTKSNTILCKVFRRFVASRTSDKVDFKHDILPVCSADPALNSDKIFATL